MARITVKRMKAAFDNDELDKYRECTGSWSSNFYKTDAGIIYDEKICSICPVVRLFMHEKNLQTITNELARLLYCDHTSAIHQYFSKELDINGEYLYEFISAIDDHAVDMGLVLHLSWHGVAGHADGRKVVQFLSGKN